MIATQGAFFNYQHFRESLKQSPAPARVWNATAMGQTRDQLMKTGVDIVAFASEQSLDGCELIPGMVVSMQWLKPGDTLKGHSHSWWHLFIIQTGCGQVVIGDHQTVQINPGDVILVPAWNEHGFVNTSASEPLSMLNLSNMPQVSALASLITSTPSR